MRNCFNVRLTFGVAMVLGCIVSSAAIVGGCNVSTNPDALLDSDNSPDSDILPDSGENFSFTITCPERATVGDEVVVAIQSATTANYSFSADGAIVVGSTDSMGTIRADEAGVVTVTVSGTRAGADGNETQTQTCEIEFGESTTQELALSVTCPPSTASTGAEIVTIAAEASRETAVLIIEADGGMLTDAGDGSATLTSNADGVVTVTITATDGGDTASGACTIMFGSGAEALDVSLNCPGQVFLGSGSANVSATVNFEAADITLVALDQDRQPSSSIILEQVGDSAAVSVANRQDVLVQATATDGVSTDIDECTIEFIPIPGLASASRTPFASQCTQAVINCTSSFPVASFTVTAGQGQTVSASDEGFVVTGSMIDGVETVQLDGRASLVSEIEGRANDIFYSWSFGAMDDNRCTYDSGTIFSSDASVPVVLETGFHYIRLTVENEQMIDPPDACVDQDGDMVSVSRRKFDFVEMLLEVRE